MADEATVTAFVVRCPLGDQCSKKQGILAKKWSIEEARAALSWHLMSSPYHGFAEEDAKNMAEAEEVEEWPESQKSMQQQQDEAWYQSRKRQRTATSQQQLQQQQQQQQQNTQQAIEAAAYRMLAGSSSASGSASDILSLPLRPPAVLPTDKVTVNKVELLACIDSLKRAKAAAESAQQLCAKASRVFGNEASCIGNCQEVLESYLQ